MSRTGCGPTASGSRWSNPGRSVSRASVELTSELWSDRVAVAFLPRTSPGVQELPTRLGRRRPALLAGAASRWSETA